MSVKRLALSSVIAVAVLGFGASPALAQIPLQPAAPAPAPVTSTSDIPSGQPVYIPGPSGSAECLFSGSKVGGWAVGAPCQ